MNEPDTTPGAGEPAPSDGSLARPEAHPHDPSACNGIEEIETALSRLQLTARRVYKWRRPVDLGYVDFRSRRERTRDCEREVALNRRLAPDVYLGVAPLLRADGRAEVGEVSEAPTAEEAEHCVVMRRLPPGADALSRLERGALGSAPLGRLAARLARFHAAERIEDADPHGVERATRENLAALEKLGEGWEAAFSSRIQRGLGELLESARPDFERRAPALGVDGHGDLRLEHVWFEDDDAEPVVIDCVEFEPAFRRLDPAVDVAFLVADLDFRGRPELATRFVQQYAEQSDDYGVYPVLDACRAYAHTVRAKVAGLAAATEDAHAAHPARHRARRHLRLAADAAAFARRAPARGRVFLVSGVVGTGKSTAASLLADASGGAVVSSDRLRRSLAADAEDRYSERARQRVYDGMLQRADAVLRSGRTAVLDATWARAARRRAALDWASERGAPATVVELRCGEQEVLRRLEGRRGDPDEASEAGPERYEASVREFEPIDDLAPPRLHVVHSDEPAWIPQILTLAHS